MKYIIKITLGLVLCAGFVTSCKDDDEPGIDGITVDKEEITIGMPLSRPLQESGLFPPMVYQMIRIGEESGNTEEMLDKLADYYEEEVEMAVQSVMAALEPMIIILLAIVVGGLVAACMLPMMNMYEALDSM